MSNSSPSLSWLCPGGQWGKLGMAKFQPPHLPALTVGEWHTAPVHNLTKTVMPPVPSNLALRNNCGERKSRANLAKCWGVAFQGDQVKTPVFSLLAKLQHHLPHATPLSRECNGQHWNNKRLHLPLFDIMAVGNKWVYSFLQNWNIHTQFCKLTYKSGEGL